MDCSRYKTLGEVCVIEHGKKFLWEFCRDFQPEVKLPEYDELMRTVKKQMAVEREKVRQKKKRERILRRKEEQTRESRKKESGEALKDKIVGNAGARPSGKIQLRISPIKEAQKTERKGQKSSRKHISSSGTTAVNRFASSNAHKRDEISRHSNISLKNGAPEAESKANGQPRSQSLEIAESRQKSVSKGRATKKSAIAEQTAPRNQVSRLS